MYNQYDHALAYNQLHDEVEWLIELELYKMYMESSDKHYDDEKQAVDKLTQRSIERANQIEAIAESFDYIESCHSRSLPYTKQHCYICPHRHPCITADEA